MLRFFLGGVQINSVVFNFLSFLMSFLRTEKKINYERKEQRNQNLRLKNVSFLNGMKK